jgi:hypothetical protein
VRRSVGRLIALLLLTTPARAALKQGDPAPAASLAEDWPEGLPARDVLASWESFTGQYVDDDVHRVSYALYVDPAFYGLYRVTRYSISAPPGATGDEALALETVQFHATPGRGGPLCFQRRVVSGPHRPWVALERGTQAYKDEMFRGVEVYVRHRATMP